MADRMYAGVKALIEENGKYLFVGYEQDGETLWIPPGGRLEQSEPPIKGLKREVNGEVSLKITPGDPVGMYHFFIGSEDDGDQVSLTLFMVEDFEGQVDIDTDHAEEDGLEDYRWMTPKEILEANITKTLKDLLREKIIEDDLPKLVRNEIPEIIEKEGHEAVTKVVQEGEKERWIREKILEEAEEFAEAGEIDELADLYAVFQTYLENRDISTEDLKQLEKEKSKNKGGFEENIILEEVK